MKVYLAARFSRQSELQGYAAELGEIGHEVTSRWLVEDQDLPDKSPEPGTRDAAALIRLGARFARTDLEDIDRSELVISFTEAAPNGRARGGRHVEFGYALSRGKTIMLVGPAENVFHHLPQVVRFSTWEDAKEALGRMERPDDGYLAYLAWEAV